MTNSHWTAGAINRAYNWEAEVVYPPVDVDRFHPAKQRESYYLVVSRFAPHKRLDLIIDVFAQLDRTLIIVGDGPLRRELESSAGSNVTFTGFLADEEVATLFSRAKAYIHAAQEDFGISAVEAMAAGCPVISLNQGGTAETVQPGVTGVHFSSQTRRAVRQAVLSFESPSNIWDHGRIQAHAQRFRPEVFKTRFAEVSALAWSRKQSVRGPH